ncbi:MAG: lipoprotein-releasing ABC transporter permease subunit [Nitrospirae bacterium]|nr:lipoprotein-releasing ABC transporter permease subunit [Nitrospirota bacterium]MCL5421192.1 lipoprotein-releasing ABC transporter permease subunit [Nitrospirota bacterium]
MHFPYQLFIALRYLKSRKRHRSVSFNTAISIGGVALGVMALLVVLSVMSGFHEDLQRKILGVNAHIVILDYKGTIENHENIIEKIRGEKDIVSASPFVLGQVMVSFGSKGQGVYLRGINPATEEKTTDIAKHLKEGRLSDLDEKDGLPGIILGKELANRLGVFRNDAITILSPTGEIGPLGMLPKVKSFKVVGIFEVGMFEYDSNLVVTGLKPAQDFFKLGDSVTGIEVRISDIYKAGDVRERIQKILGYPYHARDWMQMNKNLFSALRLEKFAMFVILVLIILVASFNIVSTLIMNVIEKQREIAILKTMGATNSGIMAIFMFQGFIIGLIGTIIGLVSGYALSYVLNTYQIIKLPPDIYYLSHLPVKMKLSDFLSVSLSAILISFLSTIYPAWQAAKLNPIEPLRYE